MNHRANLALRTLADCEAVIERGLETFVEVGQALLEIRDARLYRESHATWEDYCQERWGWGRNYTNKQVAAAEAVEALGTGVPTPPTEAHARELTPLRDRPAQMAEAWTDATEKANAEDRPVTAKDVREAVAAQTNGHAPDVPAVPDAPREPVTGRKRTLAVAAKTRVEKAVGACNAFYQRDEIAGAVKRLVANWRRPLPRRARRR